MRNRIEYKRFKNSLGEINYLFTVYSPNDNIIYQEVIYKDPHSNFYAGYKSLLATTLKGYKRLLNDIFVNYNLH